MPVHLANKQIEEATYLMKLNINKSKDIVRKEKFIQLLGILDE